MALWTEHVCDVFGLTWYAEEHKTMWDTQRDIKVLELIKTKKHVIEVANFQKTLLT